MVRKRLLIVEGDRILREAISRLFALRGWQVEPAATMNEGLSKLLPPPDCVLLDVRGTDRPVAEFIRLARASGRGSRVVILTGFALDDVHERLDGQPVDAVIEKPAEATDLFRACEAAPSPS
jgi:DNA-binding response OmpR family regulator